MQGNAKRDSELVNSNHLKAQWRLCKHSSSTICMKTLLAAKGACFETSMMAVLMIDAMSPRCGRATQIYIKWLQSIVHGAPPVQCTTFNFCRFQACIFPPVVGTHARSPS